MLRTFFFQSSVWLPSYHQILSSEQFINPSTNSSQTLIWHFLNRFLYKLFVDFTFLQTLHKLFLIFNVDHIFKNPISALSKIILPSFFSLIVFILTNIFFRTVLQFIYKLFSNFNLDHIFNNPISALQLNNILKLNCIKSVSPPYFNRVQYQIEKFASITRQ